MNIKIQEPRAWILPILIALASINGLIKALTGIRYGPLLIDVILVMLLISSIAVRFVNDYPKIRFLDLLALSFILIALLEIFNPNIPSFQAGIEGFRKFSFMIIGFFIGRYVIRTVTTINRIVWVLIIISFLISLYGIKQYMLPTNIDFRLIDLSSASRVTYLMGGHIRAFSTLSGPFHLGIYLVCSLLLILSIFLRNRRFWFVALVLGIPQLIALLMTVTKSNWAALVAGGAVLIILASRQPIRSFIRLSILGIILFFSILLLFEVTKTIPQLRTINEGLQAIVNPLNAPTMIIRFELWRDSILPLLKNAMWFGYGTGSAGEGLSNLFTNSNSIFVSAHNLFLKVQMELGLVGLVSFSIFLFISVIHIWKVNQNLRIPSLIIFRDWTLGFTVAILVSGLTSSILDAYPVNFIFWLLLGISTHLYRINFEHPEFQILPNSKILIQET